MMNEPSALVVLPPGLADLMDGLGKLESAARPRGDRSSSKFKREVAATVLALVGKFLREQNDSNFIPDALLEVSYGLDNLDTILEPVLDVVRSPNRPPVPTTHYIIRADIVALLDAMTDGAPFEGVQLSKVQTAELIVKGLGKQLEKVVSQRDGKSAKLLTNWLGKFKKGQFPDESAGMRFQSMRMQFRLALLADDPERKRRFQAKIDEIKARLEALPAS